MHTLKHKRIDFPAWNFHERASRIYERQPGNMKWGTIGVMTHNSQPDMICIPFRLRFLSPRHQLLAQLGSIAFWKVLPELEKNNNKTDSIAATTFRLETIQNKQQRRKIENFGSCGKVWVQSNNKELIMNFRTSGRKYITLTHAHNCDWALGLPPSSASRIRPVWPTWKQTFVVVAPLQPPTQATGQLKGTFCAGSAAWPLHCPPHWPPPLPAGRQLE